MSTSGYWQGSSSTTTYPITITTASSNAATGVVWNGYDLRVNAVPAQPKREETAVEWLRRRVEEQRVNLGIGRGA